MDVRHIGSESLESWELNQIEELQKEVDEQGVSNVEEFFKRDRRDGEKSRGTSQSLATRELKNPVLSTQNESECVRSKLIQ